jgi:PLP dependent protein
MPSIAENLAQIHDQIAGAARKSSRAPSAVRLIAVSKTHPASAVAEAYAAGQREFGENRIQEALAKQPDCPAGAAWHLIGHLQSNKARLVPSTFQAVHSIDSLRVAEALSRHVVAGASPLQVLLQVNLSGEATKSGTQDRAVLEALALAVKGLPGLDLSGLMTIPDPAYSEAQTRRVFTRLHESLEHLRSACGLGSGFRELSMGMSHDFGWAIEEGATLVRVGTAIFGPRRNP